MFVNEREKIKQGNSIYFSEDKFLFIGIISKPSPAGEGLLRPYFQQSINMLPHLQLTTLPAGKGVPKTTEVNIISSDMMLLILS